MSVCRRRAAAVVLLAASILSACSQTPFADDSFRERIPDALVSSDLGIVDAFAEKGVDGLTTQIFVGATFDRNDLTVDEVAEFVGLVADHTTVSVTNLVFSTEDLAGGDIDIVPQLEELGADPVRGTFVQITLGEAEAIAKDAAERATEGDR